MEQVIDIKPATSEQLKQKEDMKGKILDYLNSLSKNNGRSK